MKFIRRGSVLIVSILCLFHSSPSHAFKIVSFDGHFTRWENQSIRYTLDARGSKNFDGNATKGCDSHGPCVTLREIARKSFNTWENADGVDVKFVEGFPQIFKQTGYDNKNSIVWIERDWRTQSFMPPDGALAVTISTYRTSDNLILDSDIHMNGEFFKWADINSPEEENSDVVDVQNILTHEIGHFFGLDHSSEDIFEPNAKLYLATMFFASGPGEIFRRHLGDDDKAAAENLYPSRDSSEPTIQSITPDVIDVAMGRSATLQIRGRNFTDHSAFLIALKGDVGDRAGKPIAYADDELTAAFDLTGLPSGKYDVVVANNSDRSDRLQAGISLLNGSGAPLSDDGPGGAASTSSGGCAADGMGGSVMFLFALFLIGARRLSFSTKK